ncbi:hypothetical protein ALC60_14365 [Trachymyrmex zeteki]|uniref:Uncharacterized protein n=1 Tax=Mycetomoellerius zeteki TaxID=64791 RepID=A0A151WFK7_9HYME|nr:hypothetical protein ALC60_14365 [Trachymyrmex zeteki]
MITRHVRDVAVFPVASSWWRFNGADRAQHGSCTSGRVRRLRYLLAVHSRVSHPFVSRSIRPRAPFFLLSPSPSLPLSPSLSLSLSLSISRARSLFLSPPGSEIERTRRNNAREPRTIPFTVSCRGCWSRSVDRFPEMDRPSRRLPA